MRERKALPRKKAGELKGEFRLYNPASELEPKKKPCNYERNHTKGKKKRIEKEQCPRQGSERASVWVLLFLLPHCDFQTASYNITNNTEPEIR